jgi:hypothetical protein
LEVVLAQMAEMDFLHQLQELQLLALVAVALVGTTLAELAELVVGAMAVVMLVVQRALLIQVLAAVAVDDKVLAQQAVLVLSLLVFRVRLLLLQVRQQ